MSFRTILAVLAAAFFFLCSLPMMPVVLLLGKIAPDKADRFAYAFVCWGLRMVTAMTGCPITVPSSISSWEHLICPGRLL